MYGENQYECLSFHEGETQSLDEQLKCGNSCNFFSFKRPVGFKVVILGM